MRQVSRVLPEWRIGEVFMSVVQSKPKQNTAVEIVRIVLATIAALAATSLLVYNVVSFADAIEYYLSMGYPADEVYKHLIPCSCCRDCSNLSPSMEELHSSYSMQAGSTGWPLPVRPRQLRPNPGANAERKVG